MGAETWENRFRINRWRYRKINHLEDRNSAKMRKRFPPKLLIRLGFVSRLENRRRCEPTVSSNLTGPAK